jgi:hypothetical protein
LGKKSDLKVVQPISQHDIKVAQPISQHEIKVVQPHSQHDIKVPQPILQPVHGVPQPMQPVYGVPQPMQPVYGVPQPMQPVYGVQQPMQPVYGVQQPMQPVYGVPQPMLQPVYGEQLAEPMAMENRPTQKELLEAAAHILTKAIQMPIEEVEHDDYELGNNTDAGVDRTCQGLTRALQEAKQAIGNAKYEVMRAQKKIRIAGMKKYKARVLSEHVDHLDDALSTAKQKKREALEAKRKVEDLRRGGRRR